MSKIILDSRKRKHFWQKGDLIIEDGIIKESEIKSKKQIIKKENKLIKFEAKFQDKLEILNRGPAVINSKDVGAIIANTGINEKSEVLDAGSGSGFLAAYLSNITKNVTTYEKSKKHYKIAKSNLKKLESSVKIKNKDVFEGIDEKNLDLITLDLSEPNKVLKHAEKALKSGAYLVCYLPNITQVQDLIQESKKHQFLLEKTIELIEREWTIQKRICRPKHQILGHTAFLVFFRKY